MSDTAGAAKIDVEAAIAELTGGAGFVRFEGFYSPAETREAREIVYASAEHEPTRASHFHGDDEVVTQKRVWNLIDKGEIFRTMAAESRMLAILEPLLGRGLSLCSIAANVLYPGAPAQEPHIDYPYWDLHTRENFPNTLNASFFLGIESLIMLDELTEENGATALVPGSQKWASWPTSAAFEAKKVRLTGPAGTLVLFPAFMWHAGQENRSDAPRAVVLGCHVSKFVRPIEDWKAGLRPETVGALSPRLRELLYLDHPYPAVMDALPGRSSEGTRSTRELRRDDPARG